MAKKDELKKEIENIWRILLMAKECFMYSYYFHRPKTPSELNFLSYSTDFHFIRHILWRTNVIELCKLFRDSKETDKFNIHHLIKKLKPDGYYRSLNFSLDKIHSLEHQILVNKPNIDTILDLRDKIYSHTDNIYQYPESVASFEKTEILHKIVETVIQEIYSDIFESHAMINTVFFNADKFDVVRVLATHDEDTLKRLEEEYKRFDK